MKESDRDRESLKERGEMYSPEAQVSVRDETNLGCLQQCQNRTRHYEATTDHVCAAQWARITKNID